MFSFFLFQEHRTREHSNLTGAHDQQGFSVTTPIGENNGNSLSRSSAISTTTHGSCLDLVSQDFKSENTFTFLSLVLHEWFIQ